MCKSRQLCYSEFFIFPFDLFVLSLAASSILNLSRGFVILDAPFQGRSFSERIWDEMMTLLLYHLRVHTPVDGKLMAVVE